MSKKRGRSIENLMYALFNDKIKKNVEEVEKNYGLFYPNKTIVYPIVFFPSFSKIVTLLFYIEMEE